MSILFLKDISTVQQVDMKTIHHVTVHLLKQHISKERKEKKNEKNPVDVQSVFSQRHLSFIFLFEYHFSFHFLFFCFSVCSNTRYV